MEPESQAPPPAPATTTPDPSVPVDKYAHLRSPNHKRGLGRPFKRGELRLSRGGKKLTQRSTADLMHELTTNVLLAESPNGEGEARIVRILCVIAEKAEKGNLQAAEILFDRFGGKVRQSEEAPKEGGRVVIEWNGPPLPWMPQQPAMQPAGPDKPQKGSVVAAALAINQPSTYQPRMNYGAGCRFPKGKPVPAVDPVEGVIEAEVIEPDANQS